MRVVTESEEIVNKPMSLELATLGGGCFWCLEAIFEQLEGVEKVQSGYTGGRGAAPTYEQVCGGNTGHAEVVQVTFDPAKISYHDLLEMFFAFHDPTTMNRQGADVGTQYRSAIFVHGPEQRAVAEKMIAQLGETDVFGAPIVTEVTDLDTFYPAEAYHDAYYRRNQNQGYCRAVISPKVAKLRAHFAERLKKSGTPAA